MDANLKIKNLENIINQYKINYTSNIINLLKYEENISILRYKISQLEIKLNELENENNKLKQNIEHNNDYFQLFNKIIETPKKYYNYYINYN